MLQGKFTQERLKPIIGSSATWQGKTNIKKERNQVSNKLYYYETPSGELAIYETAAEAQLDHDPVDGEIKAAHAICLASDLSRQLLRYKLLCDIYAPVVNDLAGEEIVDNRNDLL